MSDATLDDEYDEYEAFEDDEDDDEGERGLSGLVVLLMGVVMLGAIASVVWIAYSHGVRTGEAGSSTPIVSAEPEDALKIENPSAGDVDVADREVYDQIDGVESDPVEVIAEGPEEPVSRGEDPIAAIAEEINDGVGAVDDAVSDRIASLEAADDGLSGADVAAPAVADPEPEIEVAAVETPAVQSPTGASAASGDAMSGSHLVQVGAFRSEEEANGQWLRMQSKLGDYLNGKSRDVEVADLGDKGVYYRLRLGPFDGAEAAKSYCAGLKDRGQDCLIKSAS